MKMTSAVEEFEFACRARGVGKVTWRFYGPKLRVLADYLRDEFGIDSVEGLRPTHVNRFVNFLKVAPSFNGRGVRGPHTIRAYVEAIKVFVSWCVKEELLDAGVQARIEVPRVGKKTIKTLSREQFDRMNAAAIHEASRSMQLRDQAILALLLDTGLRADELCALRVGDVHLNEGFVFVKQGKGDKQREVGPLGLETQRTVRRYLRGREMDRDDWLLKGRHHTRLTPSGLDRILYRLRGWAGVGHFDGVRVSAHTFRHTFAVNFMRQNGDIYALSLLLGHSSVAVTQNYLRDFQQREARRGQSVADQFLRG